MSTASDLQRIIGDVNRSGSYLDKSNLIQDLTNGISQFIQSAESVREVASKKDDLNRDITAIKTKLKTPNLSDGEKRDLNNALREAESTMRLAEQAIQAIGVNRRILEELGKNVELLRQRINQALAKYR